jgi:xanthine dehydrogenase small subunit
MDEAVGRLDEDISPIDDLRSTGVYRRDVAANLLRRFWVETGPASS